MVLGWGKSKDRCYLSRLYHLFFDEIYPILLIFYLEIILEIFF